MFRTVPHHMREVRIYRQDMKTIGAMLVAALASGCGGGTVAPVARPEPVSEVDTKEAAPPIDAPPDDEGAPSDVAQGRRRKKPPWDERKEIVTVESTVVGVAVSTTPVDGLSWKIRIENQTDEPMRVLWDESSFVGAKGISMGRLIRTSTRMLDIANAHPPSPLPAHAAIEERVVPELPIQHQADPSMYVAYDGGRLNITIASDVKKFTWTALIHLEGE